MEEIVWDVLSATIDDKHLEILQALDKPRYDEDMATDLSIKATIVRKFLNDLHGYDLVRYNRMKNKETGWYTYIWERRNDKIIEYALKYIKLRMSEVSDKIEFETGNLMFYIPDGEAENKKAEELKEQATGEEAEAEEEDIVFNYITFMDAMSIDFKDPETGKHYVPFDNSVIIDDLKDEKNLYLEILNQLKAN